jgi:hypothetical protein
MIQLRVQALLPVIGLGERSAALLDVVRGVLNLRPWAEAGSLDIADLFQGLASRSPISGRLGQCRMKESGDGEDPIVAGR